MSFALEENQSIVITPQKVIVAVGWETEPLKPGPSNLLNDLLSGGSMKSDEVECDLLTVLCDKTHRMQENGDLIFFNNLTHSSGAVIQAENSALPEEYDALVTIDLVRLPEDYVKIVFAASIYQARARHHNFSMLKQLFIGIYDENFEVIGYYNADQIDGTMTMLHLAQLVQKEDEWHFEIVNAGSNDDGAAELAKRYQ